MSLAVVVSSIYWLDGVANSLDSKPRVRDTGEVFWRVDALTTLVRQLARALSTLTIMMVPVNVSDREVHATMADSVSKLGTGELCKQLKDNSNADSPLPNGRLITTVDSIETGHRTLHL